MTGMLPWEGSFAIMLEETGIATRAQEMHVAAALQDKGYTRFLQQPAGETGATSTSRGGGVGGRARGAQFHRNCPREGRGPGNPHGRGRPHPHQCPRTTGRLLPVGRTGGVLGRHTNVCHGAQPLWGTTGGHCRLHQRLHGCQLQPGHEALPRGLGGQRQAARRT